MGQLSLRTISEFTDACINAFEPEEITAPMAALLRGEGYTSWFVGSPAHVDQGRGFGFYGIPKGWHERYSERGYHAYDPVFRHAASGGPSMTWSDCRRQPSGRRESRKSRILFGESAEFGLRDGLIIPVDGAGELPGCVTLGGSDLDLSGEMQMSLFIIGAFAFQGLKRLVEHTLPVPPYLTPQEMCVLYLSAEGRAVGEIGAIMKISATAVRMHRNKIKTKYGVLTMVHACALGVMDGTLRDSVAH
jgi:DNA-binding CsgD family transcriptional regulator